MKLKLSLLAILAATAMYAEEAKKSVTDHLQDVSVTIRSEGAQSIGEGSGVIFTRKDEKGNIVNFVWTAAHVVDNLRTERKVVVGGTLRTVVEFKDAKIIKVIRQGGRVVGRLELDAEVVKYSDAVDGHDLALLKIRRYNFITDTVVFNLDDAIPLLGTELYHVGSLLGQFGSNSMTDGIYSQTGRVFPELNKKIFDQTTVAAFPGSSGGGVYLKSDSRYVGMLVRGAGETFNFIVPTRRMKQWAKDNDIMWALDPAVAMPTADKIEKIVVEDVGAVFATKEQEATHNHKKTGELKSSPFLLKIHKFSDCGCELCPTK